MKRTNSLQRFNEIRAEVAAMSTEAVKHATIVEGIGTDDQILGSLFKAYAAGIVDVAAYTICYNATRSLGTFKSPAARLVAGRLAREFKSRA
jgi:hypothetical protein